ncbi:hypothetical protein ACOSQ2_021282 [Xanthoceras sorbifolium]|uniref:Bet v I/Major latex protein domain-containing protein n=1 Tax=Xanthoceras sorbifolium TaxID=99658 RepID=A0ABQ8HL55_9ROSI|nr:hypothetical protein JRO89_XS09G0102700 [Xanthoceras sorbifolium]
MSLKGKLETQLEIKAPANKFYNFFKGQTYHVSKATPTNVQDIEVHEGDWESHGSVKLWKYTVEGKQETYKERVELDEANKTVSLVGLEGDVFKYFKSWKPVLKATPKADGSGSMANLTIEYEKLHDAIADPKAYMELLTSIVKDVDDHIMNPEA